MTTERLPYYLPTEVVFHNKPDDIWVSLLGKVYDVTPLIKEYKNERVALALLAHAGKDISNWFDPKTNDLKKVVHSVTGLKVDYLPHGPIPHSNPVVPSIKSKSLDSLEPNTLPWWQDKRYHIGNLTKKARPIRVINVHAPASHSTNIIWVASEETMSEILKRVELHNSNVGNYIFKFNGRALDMMKTLDENKIPDERDRYRDIGLTDDFYIPAITLHYGHHHHKTK